ncbi:MAG: addiction module toxin, HicA family [Candidatus Competibacteraceae bacterium]|nr:MAG: addiction module toxin, HicA family [Candidatus Competibacteraceae bacterium]
MKYEELIALIEIAGWLQAHQKSSHRQFHHPEKPGTVTVSGKLGVDVPPSTVNNIVEKLFRTP